MKTGSLFGSLSRRTIRSLLSEVTVDIEDYVCELAGVQIDCSICARGNDGHICGYLAIVGVESGNTQVGLAAWLNGKEV
jgi:hypothetical protein